MLRLGKQRSKSSSRKQIQIKEVRDGVLSLPGNEYRVILETSSVNFELRSEAEQDVLIDSYQNFLNSLAGPLQIIIRIRELDIEIYVERLKEMALQEIDGTYKEQIENYASFIRELVSGNKVLSRSFYVIISYKHTGLKQDFEMIKEQLHLKQDIVVRGLEKLGMKVKPLNSLEILNLFYTLYNPQEAKIQPLTNQLLSQLANESYV